MSTNELTLTLVGWLGTEPRHYPGTNGATPFTTFRMASTRRWFDRDKGVWADGRTEWFTVKSWRSAARNVAESLRKGDPVVVHGRLSTEEWTGPDGSRTTLVLDAIAIGPDLAYGSARYSRTVHGSGTGPDGAEGDVAAGDDERAPADLSPDELDDLALDDDAVSDDTAEPDPLDRLAEEALSLAGAR
ncbi:single-stranded DNA-binding protein [Cellulomonas sp. WB94]|uniref:single-stranded DNA-binding protein n=1 Tax=Cellulomonas sp. WB94 TaxID=2173174 RepID=UPI000D57A580|nr:single-stranded DNA-binding protein [Cellulomonas sp. WB94]PVU81944.1 single-stranded DNA-binding protein [Cellulomonas sp. WB94]